MNYDTIKNLLTLLLPIGIVCFSMAFARLVFIVQDGSIFGKALKFFGSAIFGITCGYLATKFLEYRWVLFWSAAITLLAEQIIIWVNKAGFKEFLKYIRIKIGNQNDNTTQDGT